jgi:hypothetical protein
MPRSDARDEHGHAGKLLAVLGGALAGVAIGVLLADRFGGIAGIRRRLRHLGDARAPLSDRRAMAGEAFHDDPLDDDDLESDFEFDDDELEDSDISAADADLESRVLAAFEGDAILRERAVDISAFDGSLIELSGWVRSPAERKRAAEVARGVAGVGTVANELQVGDPDTIDAADLSTR